MNDLKKPPVPHQRNEALHILQSAEVLHSAADVAAAVARVAEEVAGDLRDEHPLLLCVMTGGVVFAGQLMTRLDFPLDFDYLHVSRYDRDNASGKLSWRSAPWTPVAGRTVLVVDDILDEGVTLAAVHDRLLQMGAARVLTAVLADKDNGKAKPIRANYVALTVPDRFVFGYGMDAHGCWRNLPAIYALADRE